MYERIIYSRENRLWRGRDCSYLGCESKAVTQCDAFNGEALVGNVCAEPLCEFHRHRFQGLDFCDQHKIQHGGTVMTAAVVQPLLFNT